MANQRVGPGYGDIVLVNTPTLDRLGQQLYAEQKIRQTRQQQENAALDANIQKEIGKVRSVDTPEVIKSYQDYKGLKQQLLFNKDIQKDPLKYNQLQQATNQAYQNIFSTANKSEELKDMAKGLHEKALKNPDDMSDDYGQRAMTLMNTPISQLQNHPVYGNELLNSSKYLYGGSNTDFGKMIRDASGQPKQVFSKEDKMDGGLQTKITPYNFGNTPGQVKDYMLGAMALHKTGRDAAYQWDQLPEEDIANTIKQYQAIPKEKWERMGLQGPQDLISKNPLNKAENYAAYQAMKYAITNEPKEGTPVFRDNKKALEDLKYNRELALKKIEHSNARDLIAYKKSIDPNDTELNNSWVDNYWSKRVSEAKQGQPTIFEDPNNATNMKGAHEITLDGVAAKAFARNGTEPDKLYVTTDNKILPVFFKYKEQFDEKTGKKTGTTVDTNTKGEPKIDEDYSKPMDMDQAYLSLGYKGQTKKQLAGTMKGVGKAAAPNPTLQAPKHNIEDLRKKYDY